MGKKKSRNSKSPSGNAWLFGLCFMLLTSAVFAAEFLISGRDDQGAKIKMNCDDDATACGLIATAQNNRLEVDKEIYAPEVRTVDNVTMSDLAARLAEALTQITTLQSTVVSLQQQIDGKLDSVPAEYLTQTEGDGRYYTKLGAVDDTELGHLDGVTSSIQGQLDGKQGSLSFMNEASVTGGDGYGTYWDGTAGAWGGNFWWNSDSFVPTAKATKTAIATQLAQGLATKQNSLAFMNAASVTGGDGYGTYWDGTAGSWGGNFWWNSDSFVPTAKAIKTVLSTKCGCAAAG